MSSQPAISPDRQILQALRDAPEPLDGDQLLVYVPDHARATKAKARQWLMNNALKRPEVGRVRRGAYVYLPHHVTGSTLRVPLVGTEGEDGRLRLGPDAAMALWFRQEYSQFIPRGVRAGCEMPNGQSGTMTWEPGRYAGDPTGTVLSEELRLWLRDAAPRPGDSLLLRILDGERSRCRITLERLAERDRDRARQRSRELADAVEAVLREARRRLHLFKLMAWLLARDFYHDSCPPDPLLPVLVIAEGRFTIDRYGEVALGTKWDRIIAGEEDLLDVLTAGAAVERGAEDGSGDLLRALSPVVPAAMMPLFELTQWLVAVGYAGQEPAAEEEDGEETETGRGTGQAYRVRVSFTHRKAVWRVFAVSDEETLGELDRALRLAFGHDTGDHLSEFLVPSGSGRGAKGLGHIYPFADGLGNAVRVGDLGLEAGDRLTYVYDFGEWIEHDVAVEAVLTADPEAEYPREVARNAPRYRNCKACAACGRKERATWVCIACSNRYTEDVILCEKCLEKEHPDHDAAEIVY